MAGLLGEIEAPERLAAIPNVQRVFGEAEARPAVVLAPIGKRPEQGQRRLSSLGRLGGGGGDLQQLGLAGSVLQLPQRQVQGAGRIARRKLRSGELAANGARIGKFGEQRLPERDRASVTLPERLHEGLKSFLEQRRGRRLNTGFHLPNPRHPAPPGLCRYSPQIGTPGDAYKRLRASPAT